MHSICQLGPVEYIHTRSRIYRSIGTIPVQCTIVIDSQSVGALWYLARYYVYVHVGAMMVAAITQYHGTTQLKC